MMRWLVIAALFTGPAPLFADTFDGMSGTGARVPYAVHDGVGQKITGTTYSERASGGVPASGLPISQSVKGATYQIYPGFLQRLPTFTATVTATRTATPTGTRTATPSGTRTATPTRTATRTATPTPSVTPSATPSVTPSISPSFTMTATLTATPSASPTFSATKTPGSGWYEDLLSPAEDNTQNGLNDLTPTTPSQVYGSMSAPIITGSPLYVTGTGYLSNGSEYDVFRFQIQAGDYSPCNDILKITATQPSGVELGIELDHWQSNWYYAAGGNGSGSQRVIYKSLAGLSGTQDFYLVLRSNNGSGSQVSPYRVFMAIIPSGQISGTLDPVGVGLSGKTNFNVYAYSTESYSFGSYGGTDAAGNFSISVPTELSYARVVATRYWYSSGAADYAYGPTTYKFATPQSVAVCGNLAVPGLVKVYPEARLAGLVSGLSLGTSGISLVLKDEYDQSGGGWYGNYYPYEYPLGNNPFIFHNIEPGHYQMHVDASGETQAPVYFHNITLTDGLTTTANVSFGSSGAISGSIIPAPTGTVNVTAYEAGSRYGVVLGSTSTNIGSYTISNLPAGTYDVKVGGGGGPSSYFTTFGVTVVPPGTAPGNITGVNPLSSVSGYIYDQTGLGAAGLMVGAARHGDDLSDFDVPIIFGGLTPAGAGTFTFSVPVDAAYGATWDVVVLENNQGAPGFPRFFAAISATAGATGVLLTATASAFEITGLISLGGQPFNSLLQSSGGGGGGGSNILAYLNSTATWLAGANSDYQNSFYRIAPLPGPASIDLKARFRFMQTYNQTVPISLSSTTHNIAFTVDSSKDYILPYIYALEPCNDALVTNPLQVFTAKVSDGAYGMGIDYGYYDVRVNAVAATGVVFASGSISFQPSSPLGAINTVYIRVRDTASSVNYNSISYTARWILATPTPSATTSPTFTRSPTFTVSQTFTRSATPSATLTGTPTQTATVTATETATQSATQTPTVTATETATRSGTPSFTQTATRTATHSPTLTGTPTQTATATPTGTRTVTPSQTATLTATMTVTVSRTATSTPTGTRTASPTGTLTFSASPTETATQTFSASPTSTRTATLTFTNTATITASPTSTATGTTTATATPQAASLLISKVPQQSTRFEGQNIDYVIVVNNVGLGTANGVQIWDTLPVGAAVFSGPGLLENAGYSLNDAWRDMGSNLLQRGPFDVGVGQAITLQLQVLVEGGTAPNNVSNTASAADLIWSSVISAPAVVNVVAGVATPTPTFSVSPTFTITPTHSHSASATRSATPSATPTLTATETATSSATRTSSPTGTPSQTATVTPAPNLSIVKSASVASVAVDGDRVTFVLNINNSGLASASNVVVSDNLPFNGTYLASSPVGVLSGSNLSWNVASLGAGASTAFTFSVSFTGSGTSMSNQASIDCDELNQLDSNTVNIGVGVVFSPTATATGTPSATPSATFSASPTITPTSTQTPTVTPSFTASPSQTPQATATATAAPPIYTLTLTRLSPVSPIVGDEILFRARVDVAPGNYAAVSDAVMHIDADYPGNAFVEVNMSSNGAWILQPDNSLDRSVGITLDPQDPTKLFRQFNFYARYTSDAVLSTVTARFSLVSSQYPTTVSATAQTILPLAIATPTPAGGFSTPTPTPVADSGKIVAYPQPAKAQVCFAYHSALGGKLEILVYNNALQLVAKVTDTAVGGSMETSCVDISGLAPGLYTYTAKVGDFNFPIGKLAVAR